MQRQSLPICLVYGQWHELYEKSRSIPERTFSILMPPGHSREMPELRFETHCTLCPCDQSTCSEVYEKFRSSRTCGSVRVTVYTCMYVQYVLQSFGGEKLSFVVCVWVRCG